MIGTVLTKRIFEAVSTDDGTRILVTRFRPRSVKSTFWQEWIHELAPSKSLLNDWKNKDVNMDWVEYADKYLMEMAASSRLEIIGKLVDRIIAMETITLLCFCPDEHCHRYLLKNIIDEAVKIKLENSNNE